MAFEQKNNELVATITNVSSDTHSVFVFVTEDGSAAADVCFVSEPDIKFTEVDLIGNDLESGMDSSSSAPEDDVMECWLGWYIKEQKVAGDKRCGVVAWLSEKTKNPLAFGGRVDQFLD